MKLVSILVKKLVKKIKNRLKAISNTIVVRLQLINLSHLDSKKVQVYYAGLVPKPKEKAYGGRVKLFYLNSRFPENSKQANIFYVVSSAPPQNCLSLIKILKKKGIKIVLNQNGVAYPAWAGTKTKKINNLLSSLIKEADFVLYQSEFCKQTADLFAFDRRDRFSITYNAVDTSIFYPKEKENPEDFNILLGGSQYEKYRIDSAIQIFNLLLKKIPNAKLTITGRIDWMGNEQHCTDVIKEKLKKLNLTEKVILRGPYSQNEAPGIYQNSDILLHTKHNDPCPTTVIEALSCGLPVVYSKSGGLPELVGETGGVGISVKNSWEKPIESSTEDWARAVLDVKNNLSTLSSGARARALSLFDIKNWISTHNKTFEKLI